MNETLRILIWPVTVVIIVIVLRVPLAALLRSTRRVRYRGFEVEFSQQLQKISAETRSLPESGGGGGGNDSAAEQRSVNVDLEDLADSAPNAAVVEAWRSLEAQAKALIRSRGHDVTFDGDKPYKLMQDILVGDRIIDEPSGKAFDDLRKLRNKVVHADGFRVSPELAKEYVELASRLRAHMARLAR